MSYGIKSSFFKFKVTLTMVAVALTLPKFNHLLKHFGNSENLKKNPFTTFSVTLFTNRRTNPNDYITSAGGYDETNKQNCGRYMA